MRHVVGFGSFLAILAILYIAGSVNAHPSQFQMQTPGYLNSDNLFRFYAINSTWNTDNQNVSSEPFSLGGPSTIPLGERRRAEENYTFAKWTFHNFLTDTRSYSSVYQFCCRNSTTNITAYNWTFPHDVFATNWDIRFLATNSIGAGTANVSMEILNSAGAIIESQYFTFTCAGGAFSDTHSFNRTALRSFRLKINMSQCGSLANWNIVSQGFALWSSGTAGDMAAYNNVALEYGDWLIERSITQGVPATGNFHDSNIFESVLINAGVTHIYIGGPASPCENMWLPGNTSDVDPAFVTIDWLGVASASPATFASNTDRYLNVYRIDSLVGFTLGLAGSGGAGCNGMIFHSRTTTGIPNDAAILHGNLQVNGNYSSLSGNPRAHRCDSNFAFCQSPNPVFFGTLAWSNNRGPFFKLAQADLTKDILTHFGSVQLASIGRTTTLKGDEPLRFQENIETENGFGNAYYLTLASLLSPSEAGNRFIRRICNDNTTVLLGAKSIPIAWRDETFLLNGSSMQVCAWLLTDYERSLGVSPFFTGSIPTTQYVATFLDDTWAPCTLNISNVDAGCVPFASRVPLYTISRWQETNDEGQRSELLQCRRKYAPADALETTIVPICFANVDTGTTPGGSVGFTNWTMRTSDASQSSNANVTALGAVRIVGPNNGITNSTGRTNILTDGLSEVNWEFSRTTYRPEYINLTNVPPGNVPVVLDVHMTANFNLFPSLSCTFNGTGLQYECTLRQYNTTTEADENHGICPFALDLQTNQCITPVGGISTRIYIFQCSVESVTDLVIPIKDSDHINSVWTTVSGEIRLGSQVPFYPLRINNTQKESIAIQTCSRNVEEELRGEPQFSLSGNNVSIIIVTPKHRSLAFSLRDLRAGTVSITPVLANGQGTALAGELEITFTNVTRLSALSGQEEFFTIVTVTDTFQIGPALGLDIGSDLVQLANAIGFKGFSGRLLFVILIMGAVGYAMRAMPFMVIGIVEALVFFAMAGFGFVETWVLITVILLLVVIGAGKLFVSTKGSND